MSIIERIALEAFMEHSREWEKQVSDLLVRMAAGIEALEDRVKLLEMAGATATAKDERRSFTEALAQRMTWNGQPLGGDTVSVRPDAWDRLREARDKALCHCTCGACVNRGEHHSSDCPAPECPWTS